MAKAAQNWLVLPYRTTFNGQDHTPEFHDLDSDSGVCEQSSFPKGSENVDGEVD